jgi:hypothetical protein
LLGRLKQADISLIDFAKKEVSLGVATILQARQPLIPNSAPVTVKDEAATAST